MQDIYELNHLKGLPEQRRPCRDFESRYNPRETTVSAEEWEEEQQTEPDRCVSKTYLTGPFPQHGTGPYFPVVY